MSAPEPQGGERLRFPGVRAPKPLLPPDALQRLTARQREVLDQLEAELFDAGLAGLTMAEIAARIGCSLRTLYGISPSRDELVLTVVDRRLHRIGRVAIEGLSASMPPLDALRAYLRAANEAVQPTTALLERELADIPGAQRLLDAHEGYVVAVAQSLLDRAVAAGDVEPVDTAALAHVLGGLGREFARPALADLVRASPKATADAVADVLLRGLARR